MKKLLLASLVVSLLTACTNPQKAEKVLTSQGYKDIKITGYNFAACSKDDWYHTGFTAISPNGSLVEGTVCEGLLFKGSTVRFK